MYVNRSVLGPRPVKRLVLYEFEACPYCRKVREALSMLDLEVEVRPCPKDGPRFRPWVVANGGKAMFPYLVDDNTGDALYESDDIVAHLYRNYGTGAPPLGLRLGPATNFASGLATAFRPMALNRQYQPARQPEQPLILWGFEISPYCRIAREALCSLELPYVLYNVAKRSHNRPEFLARSGRMMVPYLADPNTGEEMFESADIRDYLFRTYAT
jgi:glutathione S-transferase